MDICPKCNRPLSSASRWHYCQEVDMDSLFEGKNEELVVIFDRILAEVATWDEVAVSATKNCIVFVRGITFLIIRPMKTQLDLKFYLNKHTTDHPIRKCTLWNSKYETHIRLKSEDEVSHSVFEFIRQSYRIS